MVPIVESFMEYARPIPFKGKGLLFNSTTPRSGSRTVKVWGSYRMILDLANIAHRQMFMGCFGRYMTVCTRALLPRGATFFDIGAHVGYCTLLAAHCVGPVGRVYAFEPNPAAFAALQNHLKENGITNVRAHNVALWEANSALRLFVPAEWEKCDYSATCLPRPDRQAVEIPCCKLDDLLAERSTERIHLMKIDVEGAEPRVLAGGAEHLTKGVVRYLIIELNGPLLAEAGSSPAQLVQQLANLGFLPARLSGGRAIPTSAKDWALDPDHICDRLFLHHSSR